MRTNPRAIKRSMEQWRDEMEDNSGEGVLFAAPCGSGAGVKGEGRKSVGDATDTMEGAEGEQRP